MAPLRAGCAPATVTFPCAPERGHRRYVPAACPPRRTRCSTIFISALSLLVLVGPVVAEDNVLSGAAAFGSWRDDKPGVIRHIQATDIEAPAPETSKSNGPSPVAR